MNENTIQISKGVLIIIVVVVVGSLGVLTFTGTKYGSLREQAKEYRREIAESRATIESLREELSGARSDLDELERELTGSQADLEQAEAEARRLEVALGEAGVYIGELEEANRVLREGFDEAGTLVGDARKEIQRLIEELRKAETTNNGN